MSIEFAVDAINWKSISFVVFVMALPLLVVGFIAYIVVNKTQGGMLLGKFVSAGTVALAIIIFGVGLWQLSSVAVKLGPANLVVGGGMYQLSVPVESIDRNSVRVWTKSDNGYSPGWRTNGIDMPGLSLGWFSSKQGKIFAVITN